jgi:hypothetical protein
MAQAFLKIGDRKRVDSLMKVRYWIVCGDDDFLSLNSRCFTIYRQELSSITVRVSRVTWSILQKQIKRYTGYFSVSLFDKTVAGDVISFC